MIFPSARNLILVCLFSFFAFPAFGQSLSSQERDEVDSTLIVLEELNDDEKLKILFKETQRSTRGNTNVAEAYAKIALDIARRTNDFNNIVQAYDFLGRIEFFQRNYFIAIDYYQAGLKRAEEANLSDKLALLNSGLGIVYGELQQLSLSVYHFELARKYWIQEQDSVSLTTVLSNLGKVTKKQGEYEDALVYFDEALRSNPSPNKKRHKYFKAVILANIGNTYEQMRAYDQALEKYDEASRINIEIGNQRSYFNTLLGTGNVNIELGNYALAKKIFERADSTEKTIRGARNDHKVLKSYGDLAFAQRSWIQASDFYEQSLGTSIKNKDAGITGDLMKLLAEVYGERKQWSMAYSYLDRYNELNDSINKEREDRNFAEVMEKTNILEKEEELRSLKLLAEQRAEQIMYLGVSTGLLVFALLMIFLFYQNKRRSGQLLEARHEEITLKNLQLAAQADEIHRQNDLLTETNSDLKQFTFAISHDLREPLRSIHGFMQLLAQKYGHLMDEKGNKYVQFAINGAHRMDLMIKGMLDYYRVGYKDTQKNMVNLNHVIDQVKSSMIMRIKETNAEIHHFNLPILFGNESEFFQLFQNLIANAIKYRSVETPRIVIDTEDQEDAWLIRVTDNGSGIPEENGEEVFKLFFHYGNVSTNTEKGLGIGLATCKRIVEKHEGKIWLRNNKLNGTTFFISIPKIEMESVSLETSKV